MYNNYFHNSKLIDENRNKKNLSLKNSIVKKSIVNVNILLNRIKIEEKNQSKQKIIFFSTIVFALGLCGTFISIIK